MLTSLHIKDFAVVSAADIAFGAGLTVISGETGAGKSLLVDALMLLTGDRADAGMVRHGADRAELAAGFDLADAPAAAEWLRDAELDEDASNGDTGCQIRRVIRADGGSRAWINGRPATMSQLAELGALLVEIHGQHEHQALLARGQQLALLDAFGRNEEVVSEVRRHASDWQAAQRAIAAQGNAGDVQARLDWLSHQLNEVLKEDVELADIEDLLSIHKRQSNAAQLIDGSARALSRLQGDDSYALEPSLSQLRIELQRMAEHDARYAEAAELIENAAIQLSEAASLIERARDDLDLDPERLAQIEQRLSRLHDLARKHRVPLERLASARDALRIEHESLLDAGGEARKLEQARDAASSAWRSAAANLTKARTQAAHSLGKAVTTLLGELGMGGGMMLVELTPIASPNPFVGGAEQAEFLISANPGQPPRPLRKVASGGELSRISLAIEVAALGMDAVPTMVFDEVDSGIGGAVAEVVGQKLRALGHERQVLCVTHLPQVAAQGHQHFRVSKDIADGSTHSALDALDTSARTEELARMLGGVEITRETRANAKSMLQRAQTG